MPKNQWTPGTALARGRSGSRVLNATAYSYVIEALMHAPGGASRATLMAKSGLSHRLVSLLILTLRARGEVPDKPDYNNVLHIASWHLDARGYPTLAAYRLGLGKDASQPLKSRAEIVRDYTLRRKLRDQQQRKKEVQ